MRCSALASAVFGSGMSALQRLESVILFGLSTNRRPGNSIGREGGGGDERREAVLAPVCGELTGRERKDGRQRNEGYGTGGRRVAIPVQGRDRDSGESPEERDGSLVTEAGRVTMIACR